MVGRQGNATERFELTLQQPQVKFGEEVWYAFALRVPADLLLERIEEEGADVLALEDSLRETRRFRVAQGRRARDREARAVPHEIGLIAVGGDEHEPHHAAHRGGDILLFRLGREEWREEKRANGEQAKHIHHWRDM